MASDQVIVRIYRTVISVLARFLRYKDAVHCGFTYQAENTNMTLASLHSKKRAENEYKLSTAIAKASKAWRDAFNEGNATAAAAMYEQNATIVAKPFGAFKGREEIHAFWASIIEQGFTDVIYYNTQTTIIDQTLTAARVSANWTMNNARGIITNELWVLQGDGSALLREDHFEATE